MRSWDEVECVEGVMPHEGKGGERGRGRGRGGSVVRWVIQGERGMARDICRESNATWWTRGIDYEHQTWGGSPFKKRSSVV